MDRGVVSVQIGQCGNQLGSEWFEKMVEEGIWHHEKEPLGLPKYVHNYTSGTYFRLKKDSDKAVARAVLVDMEPKVITETLLSTKQKQYIFDEKSTFSQQTGSANNWALGYHHGSLYCEQILSRLQGEVEACDSLEGITLFQSLAGGTGSGLGARLTEAIREMYPRAVLTNNAVVPYSSGEVLTQHYNALFSIATLAEHSDATVLLYNDAAHRICQTQFRIRAVSVRDLNQCMGAQLATLFLPAWLRPIQPSPSPSSKPSDLQSTVLYSPTTVLRPLHSLHTTLCPHTGLRFVGVRSLPQEPPTSVSYSRYVWSGLLKHSAQMLIADSKTEEGINWRLKTTSKRDLLNRNFASLLIMRGADSANCAVSAFADPLMHCASSPRPLTVAASPLPFNKTPLSLSLISNSQDIVPYLNQTLNHAQAMRDVDAFLHHYYKYGMEKDDITRLFGRVEQVVNDYSTL